VFFDSILLPPQRGQLLSMLLFSLIRVGCHVGCLVRWSDSL
jgi:hypothetical protein